MALGEPEPKVTRPREHSQARARGCASDAGSQRRHEPGVPAATAAPAKRRFREAKSPPRRPSQAAEAADAMSEQLRVETLAAGGDGLARRADGAAVLHPWRFARRSLVGDLPSRSGGAFRLVEAERLEDGPQRTPARCPSRPMRRLQLARLERTAAVRAKGDILRDVRRGSQGWRRR